MKLGLLSFLGKAASSFWRSLIISLALPVAIWIWSLPTLSATFKQTSNRGLMLSTTSLACWFIFLWAYSNEFIFIGQIGKSGWFRIVHFKSSKNICRLIQSIVVMVIAWIQFEMFQYMNNIFVLPVVSFYCHKLVGEVGLEPTMCLVSCIES